MKYNNNKNCYNTFYTTIITTVSTQPGTDLCGHHQCTGCRVNGNITSHQADILKLLKQLAILLITERLDWRRVDHPLFVPQRHGYSVP